MIKLKDISFTYENSREGESQLRHVDLRVEKGELVILAGRSGCGKTTLTRVLNGLCPQFYPGKLTGGYLLDGQDALKMPVHQLGTMVGSVFQDPRSQFFTTNTTDEIVLGMENIPLEQSVMQQRVKAVCSQMNIQRLLDRRIFPLSSGEKQLIAIASICAMEPKIIVMDEPSANLDSDAMVRLGVLLYRLKEAGHTILLSEHHFHYVRASFDRLIFMENGEISSIYSRNEALSLTEAQLAAMGLRPFQPPSFQVGGAFLSKPEDTFQVSQISCMLDGRQILEDVTFSAQSGKILAIAGPNGAGKSTLCRAITGLYRSMGTVQIEGEYLKRTTIHPCAARCRLSSMPLLWYEFLLAGRHRQNSDKPLWQACQKGLEPFADRHPASLSGGQKQRLLLALAAESGRTFWWTSTSGWTDAPEPSAVAKTWNDMTGSENRGCRLWLYMEQGKVRYHRNVLRDT